jgi:hypothetical protein
VLNLRRAWGVNRRGGVSHQASSSDGQWLRADRLVCALTNTAHFFEDLARTLSARSRAIRHQGLAYGHASVMRQRSSIQRAEA